MQVATLQLATKVYYIYDKTYTGQVAVQWSNALLHCNSTHMLCLYNHSHSHSHTLLNKPYVLSITCRNFNKCMRTRRHHRLHGRYAANFAVTLQVLLQL